VGAQMTTDVAPYEMTKMRLLNGGHSDNRLCSADLLGYSYIAEAAGDPLLHNC
jgi:mannitol-1-phosphate/altronate dehydrogenase